MHRQQTSGEHQPQQRAGRYQEQQLLNHLATRRRQQQHQNRELLSQERVQLNEAIIRSKHSNNTCYNHDPSMSPWTNDTKILYSRLVKTSANQMSVHRKSSVGKACLSSRGESQEPKNLSKANNSATSTSGDFRNGIIPSSAMKNEKVTALLIGHQDQNNNNSDNISNTGSNNNISVIGHYELSKTLGKGNFSTVKLAQHRLTHHSVAIKVVKTSVLSEDNLLKINREIDVLKRLGKHNHIVRLYQVIKTKRYFMLVTEYCANGELYDYLVERGKLSESQSCNYFQQILSAVEYLHDQNVVHRDLKAENLLLTNDNKTIKIADFGFANYFKKDNLLSTWCGSPPYAAPELFKGVQYVGPPVDIWSMGVILYVLVCGSLPFDGHNLVFLKSRVLSGKFRIPFFMSTECEGLVRGMLRLEPERRFSIRQIKGHSWIAKYGSSTSKTISNANSFIEKHLPSSPFDETVKIQNCSNVSMATSNVGSTKNLEKNTNRGLSLEMEDEKVKDSNEDTSMLCLSSASGKSPLKFEKIHSNKVTRESVDAEIATAVSNISLDSNQSSMSVSQSLESSTYGVIKMDTNEFKCLSKENSMDDQIIEYMVDDLKIADSQNSIRESITNDRYDDLHAIYRLLKDQPNAQLEALITSKRFKIPSLPLISLNKQKCTNKPSITTGFFDANSTNRPPQRSNYTHSFSNHTNYHQQENEIHREQQQHIGRNIGQLSGEDIDDEEHSVNQLGAINLITRNNNRSDAPPVHIRDMRQRKSEDQSWKVPPQLFLTPPSENRHSRDHEAGGDDNHPPDAVNGKKYARRSFDSTMQQLMDSSALPNPSSNQLASTNGAKHGFWDSSILDTLGASSLTVGDNNPSPSSPTDSNSSIKPQNCDGKAECSVQMLQNLVGITTNLPQIGNQELPLNLNCNHHNIYNQTLLLGQMNQFALSTAFTQSSMFTQQPTPIEFTTNNLMNQNYTVMNNLNLQSNINSNCTPILNLLDPNGLMSVLERRASDGNTNGHHR